MHRQFGPPPQEPIVDNSRPSSNWTIWFQRIGKTLPKIEKYTLAITPASVAANTTAEQTFTLANVDTQDVVLSCTKPTHQAGLTVGNVRISGDDQIAIQYINVTGGAIVPTAETYTVVIL